MSTSVPNAVPASEVASQLESDVIKALRAAGAARTDANAYVTAVLRAIAARFEASYALARMESATGAREFEYKGDALPAEEWRKLADVLLLEARYHNVGKARLGGAGATGVTAMAVPLALGEQETNGAIALVVKGQAKDAAQAKLGEFRALAALAGASYRPAPSRAATDKASPGGPSAAQALSKAAAYESLQQFIFGVVNSLKSRTGCEQVSMGLVRGKSVRIACISGLDDVTPRSPGVREIQQAMEECLDAGHPLAWQRSGKPLETPTPAGQLLHRQWHQHVGGASVASLPLEHDGQVVAIVSFRADMREGFTTETIAEWRALLAPLAPALVLLRKADRGLPRHVADRALQGWRALRAAPLVKRLLLLAFAPALLWFCFGSVTYVVTVPCEIVPAVERRLAAPFEGVLLRANVLPGERVKAGQVLAEFDTRALLLEREKYAAELRNTEVRLTDALQKEDTVGAGMLGAQAEMLRADLDLVNYRLAQATIVAPVDGTVLEGDLRRRLGEVVPLGEPLFDLAADDRCAIELHVPEYAAALLRTGQQGVFTTLSLPDEQGRLQILHVEPLAQVVNGANVFRAEAEVADSPDWVRVGMSGVARVETLPRPVWWTMLHRALDSARWRWWNL